MPPVRRYVAVFAISLFGGCAPYLDLDQVERDIVGGTVTDQWPGVGLYLIDGGAGGLCTATLVQPGIALTASHCVDGATENDLFAVCSDMAQITAEDLHPVAEAVIHPDYSGQSYNVHDVALLLLENPIEDAEVYAVNTEPIDYTWSETWFHFVGFGSDTYYQGPGSGTKRETDVKLYEHFPEMFLTYTQGTSTCSGDSGGPAFVERDGYWYVAGVVSSGVAWSEGQDTCQGATISMRVDYDLEFLADYFDPYDSPYPEPEGDDDDTVSATADDDSAAEEEGGCECAATPGAPWPSLLWAALLAAAARRRIRR